MKELIRYTRYPSYAKVADVLQRTNVPLTAAQLASRIPDGAKRKTVMRWLSAMVEEGIVAKRFDEGEHRWEYRLADKAPDGWAMETAPLQTQPSKLPLLPVPGKPLGASLEAGAAGRRAIKAGASRRRLRSTRHPGYDYDPLTADEKQRLGAWATIGSRAFRTV